MKKRKDLLWVSLSLDLASGIIGTVFFWLFHAFVNFRSESLISIVLGLFWFTFITLLSTDIRRTYKEIRLCDDNSIKE